MEKNSTGSYLMLIGSMLIFGTIGIFRKYIPLSSAFLACARGLMGAAFLVIFVKLRGRKLIHGIGIRKVILLAVTGALMGANWLLLFEAYNHTTVAVATLCYYMEPTIVILLSPLVFGEKLSVRKIICVVVSLVGMVFVSGVVSGKALQKEDILGIVCGLAAAALYASVVIMNKKVQIGDSYEKTIIQLLAAALILVPYVLCTEKPGSIEIVPLTVILLLVVGLVHTGAAYALYFGSMKGLKAQSIALLSYIDPVSALILSAVFLHEKLSFFGIIGAVLILGAALISELNFSKIKKKTANKLPERRK